MGKKISKKVQPSTKIGEGTAKRMQMKLSKIKEKMDDEIIS
jgi:hypothetical protein